MAVIKKNESDPSGTHWLSLDPDTHHACNGRPTGTDCKVDRLVRHVDVWKFEVVRTNDKEEDKEEDAASQAKGGGGGER